MSTDDGKQKKIHENIASESAFTTSRTPRLCKNVYVPVVSRLWLIYHHRRRRRRRRLRCYRVEHVQRLQFPARQTAASPYSPVPSRPTPSSPVFRADFNFERTNYNSITRHAVGPGSKRSAASSETSLSPGYLVQPVFTPPATYPLSRIMIIISTNYRCYMCEHRQSSMFECAKSRVDVRGQPDF